ncbi:phage terminase small subunit [Anoxybacillus vitaminiphilus]|uniref:Phage terminase small subunit n=1 Tax=Paranoxybacillus vitaminiphilus TaxID=581036 RepID=A0A327YJD0_9BACL|nr:terminase small subunit [Anoxybacillus vitaminiphilus]RAK21128.1 phage terminase small subunit [Anoxybacillus vitaminiphilus]
MRKLTEKQKRFVEEYLIDLNGTQAAIRAGYSPKTAAEQASRLLKNVKVRAYIDERMAELSKRTGVNQERVLRELARIAFVNAPDLIDMTNATIREDATIDDTATIASVKVKIIPTENGQGVEREIRLADKIRALDLLGKRFAMWTERQQIDANFGIQIIDDIGGIDEAD